MDQAIEGGDGGSQDPVMDARVTRLEDDMRDVRAILARLEPMIVRIDATMPFLAKASDLSDLRTELKGDMASLRTELKGDMASLRTELKGDIARLEIEIGKKASTLTVWTAGMTLLGLTMAALAAGAVYLPFLYKVMHLSPP